MTTTTQESRRNTQSESTEAILRQVQTQSLTAGQLPKFLDLALFVVSLAVVAAILFLFDAANLGLIAFLGTVLFLIVVYAWSFAVEGRRRANNRLARYIIIAAFILALLPLVSLLWQVVTLGWARFDLAYFTESRKGVIGEGGGAAHAIVGTLIVTGLASLFSIPIGLFTAIYLVEYGRGPIKRVITFLVDVMTGIPSIVAGLFAYAFMTIIMGVPSKSGLAGAISLTVLMIPYVVRNAEEIIRLVPNSLREASYALGVTKWRTIVKIVLPTSISGIVSGVILAIARVIGETAPLLVTMGWTTVMETNPLPAGQPIRPMTALPVFVYYEYTRPGSPISASQDRAWTGALILMLIVMILNIIGRWVAKRYAPKLNR